MEISQGSLTEKSLAVGSLAIKPWYGQTNHSVCVSSQRCLKHTYIFDLSKNLSHGFGHHAV
jgi:hypothetical protein